ncbi:hypothetical protein [Amycolatopsis sp. WQ 127309]|uniref:hypothetical protein n=1 Tax=Amycolatopsis sp. WQ 127309 TaxID=2932773 RepID=UPI001FF30F43|nr:hypothetical protein [Amycolatopsis sp. WQ 127309]UOZ05446.1 hypothetical protein MUY22_42545 [Amycolatopsis sp. WQ 127309]
MSANQAVVNVVTLVVEVEAPALAALTAAIGGLFAAPPRIRTVIPLPEGDERLGQL